MFLDLLAYVASRLSKKTLVWNGLSTCINENGSPKNQSISVIIPTRDKPDLLEACINSVLNLKVQGDLEILVIDNDSALQSTLDYFEHISGYGVRILKSGGSFNYSQLINTGVRAAKGDFICVLNNDVVGTEDLWLARLCEHLRQPGIGVVGSLLKYPNDRIQHIGIALGYKGVAGHVHRGDSQTSSEQLKRMMGSCLEVSAVTFACAMFSKETWARLGGLDEKFKVGLNDVDFCVRARELGLRSVVCTESQLIHLESQSRRSMGNPFGAARALMEISRFIRRHRKKLSRDEYFS
jgi:GT2 family glycosyltransferase